MLHPTRFRFSIDHFRAIRVDHAKIRPHVAVCVPQASRERSLSATSSKALRISIHSCIAAAPPHKPSPTTTARVQGSHSRACHPQRLPWCGKSRLREASTSSSPLGTTRPPPSRHRSALSFSRKPCLGSPPPPRNSLAGGDAMSSSPPPPRRLPRRRPRR